jgi:hypothetical protein
VILSEKHKFIFIKGMKVAGTSIDERERLAAGGGCRNYSADPNAEADYLKALAGTPPDRLDEIAQPKKRYFNHMSLAAVLLHYGKDVSGFRIVCAERSPYAKVLSWANMQLSYDAYRRGGEMEADPALLPAAVDAGFKSGDIRHVRNIDRYRDKSGQVVASPLRYERLTEDFSAFARELGLAPKPLPHAKKGFLSNGLDPRRVLRADQIDRINKLFADEFSAFDYPMLDA